MFQILQFINLHNCTAVLVLSDFRHLEKLSTKARHTTVQIYELMASEPKLVGGGGLDWLNSDKIFSKQTPFGGWYIGG